MTAEFDFHEYAGPVEVGPFRVEPVLVAHPVPAYGLRVTAGGRTLAYTGDTGPCDALDRARGRVPTCCSPRRPSAHGDDNPADLHLTGREAGEVAARNGRARGSWSPTCPPWYDVAERLAEAVRVYDGDATAAVPGATYDV